MIPIRIQANNGSRPGKCFFFFLIKNIRKWDETNNVKNVSNWEFQISEKARVIFLHVGIGIKELKFVTVCYEL